MLKIVIIGAGIGGLVCAVACRQRNLDVLVLEQASEILEVGAGIQIPPNARRIVKHLGLSDAILAKALTEDFIDLRRYQDGSVIMRRECGQEFAEEYRVPWLAIHRVDYHAALLQAAQKSGAKIRLGATATEINFNKTEVVLEGGEVISGDVIVGADGLWSNTRNQILGHPSPPIETGDLAYRATFSDTQLLALDNSRIDELAKQKAMTIWIGPEKHTVFYPLRGGTELNLVLIRPDNLPSNISKTSGNIGEMRQTFEGWDPVLTEIISCIPRVLKWKLCHHEELPSWCKNNVAILGDACHPTLPYQAQGAAMAMEDGAVLGQLLGNLACDNAPNVARTKIASVLELYESLRKRRTSLNVKGAIANRDMFHMADGPMQEQRDEELRAVDWIQPCRWQWGDPTYQTELLGFDVIEDCDRSYTEWSRGQKK